MITELLAAIGEVAKTTGKVLDRIWGGQSRSQAQIEADAEEAVRKKHAALAMLNEAQKKGDARATEEALSAVNGWAARLDELRAEARAKFGGGG